MQAEVQDRAKAAETPRLRETLGEGACEGVCG